MVGSAVLAQLRDRPVGKRQSSLLGTGKRHLHQCAELLCTENGRTALRVGDLLKRDETALIEAVNPIVDDGEMAAYAVRGVRQGVAVQDLFDDPIPLVHPGGKRKVVDLCFQDLPFTRHQRPQHEMLCHAGLPCQHSKS